MVYLLDADAFITPKNTYYPFDVCPAYWDFLLQDNRHGSIRSVEKIQKELVKGNDDLAVWAKLQGDAFFLLPDDDTNQAVGELANWAKTNPTQTAHATSSWRAATSG